MTEFLLVSICFFLAGFGVGIVVYNSTLHRALVDHIAYLENDRLKFQKRGKS